jgi:hypothetical protein
MTVPKFPRRYAQRQALALRHVHATTSTEGSSSHKCSQTNKPRSRKEHGRGVASNNKTSPSESESLSDDKSDSDCGSDQDSGYSSSSSRDAKAEYYQQKRAEYAAAGPTMSDPGDEAKAAMRAEEKKWNL